MTAEIRTCTPKFLDRSQWLDAAKIAVDVNPANAPNLDALRTQLPDVETADIITPDFIAANTKKIWRGGKVHLGVTFLDNAPQDVRKMILSHLNAWNESPAEILFQESSQGDVRISRERGGYWSFLGTDILSIPRNQPTMNLEGCGMNWPESERRRVIRHEAGHTLGMEHEQMRPKIISRIDPEKCIRYFKETQGWSRRDTIAQVLTPLNENALTASPLTDELSIMCYQLPGTIMKDGKPVAGGDDINATDKSICAKIYPRAGAPPIDPPVPGIIHVKQNMTLDGISFETVEFDLRAE